jgi:2,5-diamino-6-(ribosylamino)-4(3H)-pyrimidinone 5'-phosphate reductase
MLPHVIIHNSISADGRIDWIEPDLGMFYEIAMRFEPDAHLAGSETIYNPEEEIPEEDESAFKPLKASGKDARPILVIPDSRGRVRNWHLLKGMPYWRDMVALCSKATPKEYLMYLKKRHVNYIVAGDEKVDIKLALELLNKKYKIKTVLLDSGGTLNGIMLRLGLVNEISLLINPNLVGGLSVASFYRAKDLTSRKGVIELKVKSVKKLDGDVIWLRYNVIHPKKPPGKIKPSKK